MADPLATKQPAAPVDYARMMTDVKIKLMHVKRGLQALSQELVNRKDLWDAAKEEIEMLEAMNEEAKAIHKNKKAEIRGVKKSARKSKDEDKMDEKPEDGVDEKKTPEDKDNVEKNE